MPQNLSAQIFCPSPKVWDFNEKRDLWVSVVRDISVQIQFRKGSRTIIIAFIDLLFMQQRTNENSDHCTENDNNNKKTNSKHQ